MEQQDSYYEHSFSSARDGLAFLLEQDIRTRRLPVKDIRLQKESLLLGDKSMEFQHAALTDLLKLLGVPENFRKRICDEDLLMQLVNHLAKGSRKRARVVIESGLARSILVEQSHPIDHRLVLEQLLDGADEGTSVVLSPTMMRITFLRGDREKLANGEDVLFGHEVVNSGTRGLLTISPYLLIRTCRNGAISRRPLARFEYGSHKGVPLSRILSEFREVVLACYDFSLLVEGLNTSIKEVLGKDVFLAERYLVRLFGKRFYDTSLKDSLGDQSNVFDLLSAMTQAAKIDRLAACLSNTI